jgi:hypothetical protein
MTIRSLFYSALAILLCLAITVPPLTAQEADEERTLSEDYVVLDDVIAWVGSAYISQSEYEFEKMRQREMLERSDLTSDQLQAALKNFDRRVFDTMVERELVLQAGEDAGLRVPDYEMDLFLDNFIQQNDGINSVEELDQALQRYGSDLDAFKRESRQGLMMEKVRKNLIFPRIQITEEEVNETYMAHQDQFLIPAWVQLEEILLKTTPENREQVRQRAEEVIVGLRSGERSFPDTARLISNGPSAEDGGDIGSFPLDDLSGALRELVEGLEQGEVSDPVEKADGFQIIRVAEKHPATFKPLLEVEGLIRETLMRERQMDEQELFIQELREQAYIKIYPEELQ